MQDGRLLVGGLAHAYPMSLNRAEQKLRSQIEERYPQVAGIGIEKCWVARLPSPCTAAPSSAVWAMMVHGLPVHLQVMALCRPAWQVSSLPAALPAEMSAGECCSGTCLLASHSGPFQRWVQS